MIEYKGKHTNATVMIDSIDETTAAQIIEFINNEAFTNPVAIMPDCHAGKGSVIGFTMKIGDKVIPNTIGVDIGCGMLSFDIGKWGWIDTDWLDRVIREAIPFGQTGRLKKSKHFDMACFVADTKVVLSRFHKKFIKKYPGVSVDYDGFSEDVFKDIVKKIGGKWDYIINSIGTLGGGNHFIEVGKDERDYVWITIHSGSRNFGKLVAEYHQDKAVKARCTPALSKDAYIKQVKAKFPRAQWGPEINKYESKHKPAHIPKGMEYLLGGDAYEYMYDMVVAQMYADYNRYTMMGEIGEAISVIPADEISTIHNFIDFDDWTIRKGAIRSYKGELMIIPFNMEDGILICEGKSNPEWNYSAPHGAGRVYSRSRAKAELSLEDAKASMKAKGVHSSHIPLDEVREAYKDPEIIEICIEPTASIINRIKPILNMKG